MKISNFYNIKTIAILSCIIISAVVANNCLQKEPEISNQVLLEKVMQYDMHDMIKRCKKDHNYSDEDMLILEKELKRYLFLSMIKDDSYNLNMYSKDIDNLWHSFILFTKRYHNFCFSMVNKFIHHLPNTDESEPSEEELIKRRKEYKDFIELYEQTFGEQIHPIWLLDSVEMQSVQQ